MRAAPSTRLEMSADRFRVSRDTPALFVTAVAKDRLPVFRTAPIKELTCRAVDKARQSCGFLLLAYVVMPDHLHLVTDNRHPASEVLRFVKGIIAHDLIEHLKKEGCVTSLQKLRHEEGKRRHRHSVWGHESNVVSVFSENVLMQKVNYVHLNPVRTKLVERSVDYRWSSARCWNNCPSPMEPLAVDVYRIDWRRSASGGA